MANKIKTLVLEFDGDVILPRTVSDAVTMDDGTTLTFRIKNLPSGDVKLPEGVASLVGLTEGTDLSTFLTRLVNTSSTANTLAVAEIVD